MYPFSIWCTLVTLVATYRPVGSQETSVAMKCSPADSASPASASTKLSWPFMFLSPARSTKRPEGDQKSAFACCPGSEHASATPETPALEEPAIS